MVVREWERNERREGFYRVMCLVLAWFCNFYTNKNLGNIYFFDEKFKLFQTKFIGVHILETPKSFCPWPF